MKCPYCKIHYMDDTRECPMCGKRNPRYKHGGGWETNQTGKKQAETHTKHENAKQVRTRAVSTQNHSPKTQSQKKNGVRWISILTAIIMVVLPVVSSVIDDLSSNFFENDTVSTVGNEEEILQHASELLDGTWECEETGEILTFHMDSFEYELLNQENGWIDIVQSSVEEEGDKSVYFYYINFYPEELNEYTMLVSCTEDAPVIFTILAHETSEAEAKFWERKETNL